MKTTIRMATPQNIDAVNSLYGKLHNFEKSGLKSTGRIRGVYPTVQTARSAVCTGDLFVEEFDGISNVTLVLLEKKL